MIDIMGKTLEQVLREIADALISQGERCMVNDQCVYGNDRGQHCAIGFLLPEDDKNLMGFEGCFWRLLKDDALNKYPHIDKFLRDNQDCFETVQWLHDAKTLSERADHLAELEDIVGFDCLFFQPWVDMGTE